jgi:hypothetical protein
MSEARTTWDDVKPGSPAWEKMLADAKEVDELHHLAWPRDAKDMHQFSELMRKSDPTCDDLRYAYELIGEVAGRLREAKDHPEKRELRRWQNLQFAVAVSAGRDFAYMLPFLKSAATNFAAVQPPPKDESDLLVVATWTMAILLDVLTSDPAKFDGVQETIKVKLFETFPGVRHGRMINGQLVVDSEPQVIPFPGNPSGSN